LQTDIGTGGAITHPSILQSTIHKNLRKLTISTTGRGERDLFLSYVVEAPVWKTTYRVVLDAKSRPLLRGWALVDNVQDEDWNDVTLSLVSGPPSRSFRICNRRATNSARQLKDFDRRRMAITDHARLAPLPSDSSGKMEYIFSLGSFRLAFAALMRFLPRSAGIHSSWVTFFVLSRRRPILPFLSGQALASII
jgi:hypothetical protein